MPGVGILPYLACSKAKSAADDADVRVQRKNEVSPEIASGHANIADNADQAAAGNENPEHLSPDLLQLIQERLVILNVPELIRILVVALEVPIGRRRDDEMDGLVIDERQVPCVSVDQSVDG